MARTRKPKVIEVGKCYRLLRWAGCCGAHEPDERVVYVYGIEGKKQRTVMVEAVVGHDLGWNATSYTEFLKSVHSEVPNAKN